MTQPYNQNPFPQQEGTGDGNSTLAGAGNLHIAENTGLTNGELACSPADIIQLFCLLDQIHITLIHPDSGAIAAYDFGTNIEAAQQWISENNLNGFNAYFTVNRVIDGLNKKPGKSDIIAARWLHLDSDPPKDGGAFDKSAVFQSLMQCQYGPPDIVVDSGNGVQAFWKLHAGCTLDIVEQANTVLRDQFGGDSCQNIDRLMRVPGTINWPNAGKRSAGFVPVLAKIQHWGCGHGQDAKWVETIAADSNGHSQNTVHAEWTDKPEPGWDTSLEDDDTCLERMFKAHDNKPSARFGYEGGIHPRDLWFANYEKLAKHKPGNGPHGCDDSALDASMACQAIWWKGHNCEAAKRLMLRSGLVRNKWDRPGYLENTILSAHIEMTGKFARPLEEVQPATNGNIDKVNRVIGILIGWGVAVLYNVRSREFEVCLPDNLTWKDRPAGCLSMNDATLRQLCSIIGQQVKTSMDVMKQALQTIGDRSSYDPVLDYLEGLHWDGQPRLELLLPYYACAEDTALSRAFGKHFLLGAVARAYWPGCAHDTVLTLIGPQGVGKSSLAKILGGEWHSDAPVLGLDAQKVIERLGDGWIHEIAEVKLTGKDGAHVKAFLTTITHKARAAFGYVADNIPARHVHISTGNDEKFLTDPTGNRRWHVAKVGKIKTEELESHRDQLWAEAVATFKALHPDWQSTPKLKRRIHFPEALWDEAAQAAEEARLNDPLEDVLLSLKSNGLITYETPSIRAEYPVIGFATSQQIIAVLCGQGWMRKDDIRNSQRLMKICKALGWQPHRQRISDGSNLRGFLVPI